MAIVLKAARKFAGPPDALPDVAELEVGDRVALVESSYSGTMAYFRTVVKVTPAQVVLDNGNRYRRADGSRVGDAYAAKLQHVGHPEVLRAQQSMIMKALKNRLAELLSNVGTTGEARAKVCRQIELDARQAAERVELLERQAQESAAEIALIVDGGGLL